MHKSSLRKLVILLPGMAAMAVCWALPALAVSEGDVEAAVASQGKEAVSGNLFVWFLCAIAFLKVSTKIDSILQAMGLGVGRAPGSILAEAFMALRGMQAGKAVLSGQMPGAGNRSAAAGASAASAFSGGLAGMVSSKLETDTAASMSGSGGGVTSGLGTSYIKVRWARTAALPAGSSVRLPPARRPAPSTARPPRKPCRGILPGRLTRHPLRAVRIPPLRKCL